MLFGKHINKYYLKYAHLLILGVLSLFLIDYFLLFVPKLYNMIITGINEGMVEISGTVYEFNVEFLLNRVCMPMLLVIVCVVIGRFLWRICFPGAGIKMETDLRRRMFDRCKDLSQQYYQHNKVGNLMSLFTNDLETVQDCFNSGVLFFFDALMLGVLAMYNMFSMDMLLTLLALIPMAILLISGMILEKYLMLKWKKRQEAFSAMSDFSQESFAGIAVIKAFVKESKELMAFKKLNKDNENANVEYTKLSVMLNISITLLVESVICVILGYGGYLVYCGSFSAGDLVEFIGYFSSTVWPILAISQLIEMASRGKASLNRIGELLDAEIDVKDREGVTDPGELSGNIEFRDLTFSYPGADRKVLENVSFKINAGESVGIVGRTGSGKTTIVDLILRTYNVPDGTVLLDGIDVNDMSISAVRRNAAYVPQDNFLFSDTIESNIAFATDGGSSDDVVASAKLADIHGNITEFSEGYSTTLGERGVTVSGGQKQRISIARALMKNAPILILDDSVSAVDVKTEKIILENLANTRKGKTTILIAHRITTVERMDKIIFIDDGRILAVGSHDELCRTCPEYKVMVELQRLDSLEGSKQKDEKEVGENA